MVRLHLKVAHKKSKPLLPEIFFSNRFKNNQGNLQQKNETKLRLRELTVTLLNMLS